MFNYIKISSQPPTLQINHFNKFLILQGGQVAHGLRRILNHYTMVYFFNIQENIGNI